MKPGWERYTNKRGQKDVRLKGALSGAVFEPKAYRAAKADAVRAEKAAKALSDFDRDFARTAAEARAKNPVERSAMESAVRDGNRAVRSARFKG